MQEEGAEGGVGRLRTFLYATRSAGYAAGGGLRKSQVEMCPSTLLLNRLHTLHTLHVYMCLCIVCVCVCVCVCMCNTMIHMQTHLNELDHAPVEHAPCLSPVASCCRRRLDGLLDALFLQWWRQRRRQLRKAEGG